MQIVLLLQLILAHICTDFIFQTKKIVKQKNKYNVRSWHLHAHALLSGFLSLLFINKWEYWYVGLFIALTHFLIDWLKILSKKENLKYFLIDQLAHIIVIIMAWLFIGNQFEKVLTSVLETITSLTFLMITIAYLIVIFPLGLIIDKATKKLQKEVKESEELEEGLDKAGRYIGILERILVLTFVLLNQLAAIGFLIAAKSILRYGDKDSKGARKQTEYVLIGTLLSFTMAIIIGLLVRFTGVIL